MGTHAVERKRYMSQVPWYDLFQYIYIYIIGITCPHVYAHDDVHVVGKSIVGTAILTIYRHTSYVPTCVFVHLSSQPFLSRDDSIQQVKERIYIYIKQTPCPSKPVLFSCQGIQTIMSGFVWWSSLKRYRYKCSDIRVGVHWPIDHAALLCI